jgi:excisionase family DNA binding protein
VSKPEDEARYYTAQEVATMLGVSVRKVLLMVRLGALPAVRVPPGHLTRIPAHAFDEQFPRTSP